MQNVSNAVSNPVLMETFCLQCQILFSGKNKKNIISLSSAEFVQLDAPSDWRPGGRGFNPAKVGNILSWRLIMKYFLRSFSLFRCFKKGSCQFLAKECAQYWLTA